MYAMDEVQCVDVLYTVIQRVFNLSSMDPAEPGSGTHTTKEPVVCAAFMLKREQHLYCSAMDTNICSCAITGSVIYHKGLDAHWV